LIALLNNAPTWLRRPIVTVVGVVVVLVGIALLVLPGPGLLVIALGLALLATEYAAVRRLLDRIKARLPVDAARARVTQLLGRRRV
jgi:uncharacterized protein (TIGR02611 family)